MEKFMSKVERDREIEKLSKLKLSLYEQREVARKTGDFLSKMTVSEDGDKMRKPLMKICKMRTTRIDHKIDELKSRIFKLQKAEEGDFLS